MTHGAIAFSIARAPRCRRTGEGDPAGCPSCGQIAGGRRHRV